MGLSEYQRKDFDLNNCHPHHERWELAITHTELEFRQSLENSFMAGEAYNSLARGTWDAPSFDEWFSENYGGILGPGNISPEDRKAE